MNLTLITANRNYSSWSLRPWLLMRALGIGFDDRVVPFSSADNFAAFRDFSPTGQVPVLIDGERVIPDSLGITLYLADRYPGVFPDDEDARAYVQRAVTQMHGGFGALRSDCTMNVGVRVADLPMRPELRRDLARVDELLGEGLARFGGPFLAGPMFSAADAFFAPVVFRIRTYDLPMSDVVKGWCGHMLALPAMAEWERAALAETWREASHEAEIGAAGRIVADFRAKSDF